MSKRQGFPQRSSVKHGDRLVGSDKELIERLGRNDCLPAWTPISRPAAFVGRIDGSSRLLPPRRHWHIAVRDPAFPCFAPFSEGLRHVPGEAED